MFLLFRNSVKQLTFDQAAFVLQRVGVNLPDVQIQDATFSITTKKVEKWQTHDRYIERNADR